jgi:hypothetical protein
MTASLFRVHVSVRREIERNHRLCQQKVITKWLKLLALVAGAALLKKIPKNQRNKPGLD